MKPILCKLTALLCTVCLLCTAIPTGVVLSLQNGEFEYTVTDGAATVTGYLGSATDLTVPATIDGYPVVAIGANAFYNCTTLRTVSLSASIERINTYAFGFCDSLIAVTLPASLTTIANGAFFHCPALKAVDFPDALTTIGDSAFFYCASLESVTIPRAVTQIGESAFSGCTALHTVNAVSNISSEALTIGEKAFYNCSALENLTLPVQLTAIGAAAFYNCSALKNLTLPVQLTAIGENAFSLCSSLESVVIPGSVTMVGQRAFEKCSMLKDVTFSRVDTPPEAVTIGGYAFNYCTKLESVVLPQGLSAIEENTFNGCTSLHTVVLPDGLPSISPYAFRNCSALKTVTIPDSVTSVGAYAFQNCAALETVAFPDKVAVIGEYAFQNCTALKTVSLPLSITSVGQYAFNGCTSMTDVLYLGDANDRAAIRFEVYNTPLLNATWWYNAVAFGTEDDFVYKIRTDNTAIVCQYVGVDVNVRIPSVLGGCPVTAIEATAFSEHLSLKAVTFPDSLTDMSAYMFNKHNELENIFVDDNNPAYTDINGVLFSKDKTTFVRFPKGRKASHYTVPDGVTLIENYAFYGDAALSSISLPASVTEIYPFAFDKCTALTTVYYGGSSSDVRIHIYNTPISNATWWNYTLFGGSEQGFTYQVNLDRTAYIRSYDEDAAVVNIPATLGGYPVTDFNSGIFEKCTALTAFTVDPDHQAFTVVDGVLYSKDKTQLLHAPDGMQSASFTLIGTVTAIKQYAFNGWDELKTVYYEGSADDRAALDIGSLNVPLDLATWYVNTVGSDREGAFSYLIHTDNTVSVCAYSGNDACLTIPATLGGRPVVGIKYRTFATNYNPTVIVLPGSLTSIDKLVFNRFFALEDVYYSGSKKAWNAITIDYGNEPLTSARIHFSQTSPHWQFAETITPATCTASGTGRFICDCGYETVLALDAIGHNYQPTATVAPTCTTDGYTVYTCSACNDSYQADMLVAAHSFSDNVCVGCHTAVSEVLASPHKYPLNYDNTWVARQNGAESVTVTFSAETSTDEDFDFIYLYDAEDTLVGTYTGTALAGQSVTVPGDTVKIRLTSDGSLNDYGFSVENITASVGIPSPGDINNDGETDTKDVRNILFCTIGQYTPDDQALLAADINGDGKVNTADARDILVLIIGGGQ